MKGEILKDMTKRLTFLAALCAMISVSTSIVAPMAASSNVDVSSRQSHLDSISQQTNQTRLKPTMPPPDEQTRKRVLDSFGRLPLSFEENRGQVKGGVRFLSRGKGYTIFLTPTEAVFSLKQASESARSRDVLRMKFAGANPEPEIRGLDQLPGRTSYITGNDRSEWRSEIPTFERVQYSAVYPGIDAVYYGNQRNLEYDFVVSPGADPKVIEITFEGARSLSSDNEGNLHLRLARGSLVQHAPVIYQETESGREIVSGGYVIKGENRVSFEIGEYDKASKLVIDPVLSYLTYLGGTDGDLGGEAKGIAVDFAGNAYITGRTGEDDFPISSNAFQEELGQVDVFVTKLNSSGTNIVYSTFIGGQNFDTGLAIAVTTDGKACITGQTNVFHINLIPRNLWPLTSNAFQRHPFYLSQRTATIFDAFVTVLNSSGSDLIYSTYYGGNGIDAGRSIAVDNQGKIYIAGETASNDLAMKNSFDASFNGNVDGFVAKFDPMETRDSDTLVYATYLGGSGDDRAHGIAVDSSRNAYIVGQTDSANFPTRNPFQTRQTNFDAFLTKINPSQSGSASLVYSTILGGNQIDIARSVAVDSSGSAYVTGSSESTSGFPLLNPLDDTVVGSEIFITKFNSQGNGLIYSTFLGGDGDEEGRGIAIDSFGLAYVIGKTNSGESFPVVNPLPDTARAGEDAFVLRLSSDGQTISYSTLLGGIDEDVGNGIDVDGNGEAYIAGRTTSSNLPVTENVFQPQRNGPVDGFVAKITSIADLTLSIADTPDPVSVGQNVTYTITVTNNGPDIATGISVISFLPGPALATFVSTSASCQPQSSPPSLIECETAELLQGDSTVFTITIRAISGTTLQVLASADGDEDDNGPGLNFDLEATQVAGAAEAADLSVTALDSPDPAGFGDDLVYSITVKNDGPDTATNAVVTTVLPAGVNFTSVKSKGISNFNAATRTITTTFASLATGVGQVISVLTKVNLNNGSLTANMSVTSSTPDPNAANDAVSVITTVQ